MNFSNRTIDFVKHQNKFFAFSIIAVIVGIILLFTLGLNLGIDFASGSRVDILADKSLTAEEVTEHFAKIGDGYVPDQITLAGDNNEMANVKFVGMLEKEEEYEIKAYFMNEYGHEPTISSVSSQVGEELARNAFTSVLIASLGIVIYVAFRFQILYGIAAVIALLHDAFFIIVVFAIAQFEVNTPFIAAILTIVGYSINDTIVTFDRIRENLKFAKKVKTYEQLAEIVNKSLTQTLSRSINTVLTVLFAAVAVFIFGGEAIRSFAFALVVGLIAGTYSSMFLAAQLWLVFYAKKLGLKKSGKSIEPKKEV